MSNMFANYENLSNTYVPNNQKKEFIQSEVFNQHVPKKEYDKNGKFIGYSFSYGDTLEIPYSVNKTILVESDAIIYELSKESPSTNTAGIKGQKAYNTADLRCWVCTSLDSSIYEWKELSKFVYPKNGTKEITLLSEYYSSGKQVKFTIYNFRHEELYSNTYSSNGSFSIVIDKELSDTLLKGIYYCSVEIFNEESSYVDSTFLLIVKDSVQDKFPSMDENEFIPENPIDELIREAVDEWFEQHPELFEVDSELSLESERPVQNKIITDKIYDIESTIDEHAETISNNVADIQSLQEDVSSLNNTIEDHEERVSSIEDNIEVIETNVYGNTVNISSNTTEINSIKDDLYDESSNYILMSKNLNQYIGYQTTGRVNAIDSSDNANELVIDKVPNSNYWNIRLIEQKNGNNIYLSYNKNVSASAWYASTSSVVVKNVKILVPSASPYFISDFNDIKTNDFIIVYNDSIICFGILTSTSAKRLTCVDSEFTDAQDIVDWLNKDKTEQGLEDFTLNASLFSIEPKGEVDTRKFALKSELIGEVDGIDSAKMNKATSASGSNSVAMGLYTKAVGDNQLVIGRNNIEDNAKLFIIGNGGNDSPNNALTIDQSGNLKADGDLTDGYDNKLRNVSEKLNSIWYGDTSGEIIYENQEQFFDGGLSSILDIILSSDKNVLYEVYISHFDARIKFDYSMVYGKAYEIYNQDMSDENDWSYISIEYNYTVNELYIYVKDFNGTEFTGTIYVYIKEIQRKKIPNKYQQLTPTIEVKKYKINKESDGEKCLKFIFHDLEWEPGLQLWCYLCSRRSSKYRWRHPLNYNDDSVHSGANPRKRFGFGSYAGKSVGSVEGALNRSYQSDIPDWMQNEGFLETEFNLEEEDVENGFELNLSYWAKPMLKPVCQDEDDPSIMVFENPDTGTINYNILNAKEKGSKRRLIKFAVVKNGKIISEFSNDIKIYIGVDNINTFLTINNNIPDKVFGCQIL